MKYLYKAQDENLKRYGKTLKRINIFLTKEEYAKLYRLKHKYMLSYTYIAKIVYEYLHVLKPINDQAKNGMFYKTTNKKTSIKIFESLKEEENKAKYINNLIVIFLDGLHKNMVKDEKLYQKINNEIYNQMELTQDPFYNYNENVRQYVYMKQREIV